MDNDLKEILQTVIRDEMVPIREQIAEIQNEQQFLKRAMLETNERLHTIETEQNTIKQAVMETNQAVQRLEAIQEQQHRIIEMLSVRSIEQEAELRRIK